MTGKLIIYGATGYTGQLVSEQAKRAGLDFIVAGRDAEKVRVLAEKPSDRNNKHDIYLTPRAGVSEPHGQRR